MGLRILAEKFERVPKLLLRLLPNPINIEEYQRDPMLVHAHCCSYKPQRSLERETSV